MKESFMKEAFMCFYKRKQGTCPWRLIGEMDDKINQIKQYKEQLNAQMKSLEKLLNDAPEKALSIKKTLHDGCINNPQALRNLEKSWHKPCIYQKYGCFDIYQLKKNVYAYHKGEWRGAIHGYNQLSQMLQSIEAFDKQIRNAIYRIHLIYRKQPFPFIGYSVLQSLEELKHAPFPFTFFYMNKDLIVHQISIGITCHASKEVFKHTSFYGLDTSSYWVKIDDSEEVDIALREPIVYCVQLWIQKWQSYYKTSTSKLAGCYIEMRGWEEQKKQSWTHELHALHFKSIGQMQMGQFEPNQLLISRC